MTMFLYIAVMAGVTYLIRMIPFTLFRKKIKSVGDKLSGVPSNRNDGNNYTFY